MIVTELYNGQGLGNQLWCYATLRAISHNKNFNYGIKYPEKFKGKTFINIDFGLDVIGGKSPDGGPPIELPQNILYYYKEKLFRHPDYHWMDISCKDNVLYDICDNCKIDGTMQAYSYVVKHKQLIKSWIKVQPNSVYEKYNSNDICIIHFRGGDVTNHPTMVDVNYYKNAINAFKEKNINIKFLIVTDDPNQAQKLFPGIEIIGSSQLNISDPYKADHHLGGPIEHDFYIMYYCKNIIIPASSFSWWAVWLNDENKTVVAPKYWAGYQLNAGLWSCSDMAVENWNYLDKDGEFTKYVRTKNL